MANNELQIQNLIFEKIETLIVDYYLESGDFNGISISEIISITKTKFSEIANHIKNGIKLDRFRTISSDHEMNPHIIRQGFKDQSEQIKSIRFNNRHHTCIYPTISLLKEKVPFDFEINRPFRRKLSLGIGQLEILFFDVDLLEIYRSDPRYYYECNEVGGYNGVEDKFFENENMRERDKIFLKAFGFAYDDDFNRYVAAFACDIAELSPEHQNIWYSKRVEKNLKVHPDFYGSQILNKWPDHISIFNAVLYEQKIINLMVKKMEKPPLFMKEFGDYLENKPKEFAFLLRPTTSEYNSFILLMDQLMSENLNKDFFFGDVPLNKVVKHKNGIIENQQKGTIVLLNEWLRKHLSKTIWDQLEFIISTFRDIRKQRQHPAHIINQNTYCPELINKQRELMKNTYEALRIFRCILSTNPSCIGHDFNIPKAIIEQKIWCI